MCRHLFSILFVFAMSACGVKGQPLPPMKPRELGIGKPVYPAVDKEIKKESKKDKESQ